MYYKEKVNYSNSEENIENTEAIGTGIFPGCTCIGIIIGRLILQLTVDFVC